MSKSALDLGHLFTNELFLPVPTSSLIHLKLSLADLYVRLPSERMVKVAHKGGEIDVARIERFGSRNVDYLYVTKSEFNDVVSSLVRGVERISQFPNIPTDLKLAKFFSIAESVYLDLISLPISDESLGRATRLTKEIADQLKVIPDFEKLLKTVVSLGDQFTRHSLGTVIMANLVSVQLGWKSQKVLSSISQGAFFRDLGYKEIPTELHFKPRLEMTKDEVEIWETHPDIGLKILSPVKFLSTEAIRIIHEHHELPNGSGFPQKIRQNRIFPMAKVVGLADALAAEVFDKNVPIKDFSVERITQRIDHIYAPIFGMDLAVAARRIFKSENER